MSGFSPVPALSFSLLTPTTTRFGPRLGTVVLKRTEQTEVQIQTPGFLTWTSRGVIPHLSRDHYGLSGISWVNVPFESFLDVLPPVPTLVPGKNPLHSFLGFPSGQHIVSLSARDPADGREMPPNGNAHLSAYSLRGVRKLPPVDWRSYVYSCKPDVVFALTDTPFTNPPYSQKRLTKSIERSVSWIVSILASSQSPNYKPNVLVHMAGAASIPARRAFAEILLEKLFGPDADVIKPLETIDQGVVGYAFDLVPMRLSLEATEKKEQHSFYSPQDSTPATLSVPGSTPAPAEVNLDPTILSHTDRLSLLLRASLEPLPATKLRLVNTAQTPHEILRLITSIGIDLFDAYWAQRASDIGVALNFSFPPPPSLPSALKMRPNGKRDIGHNLYDESYTHDFSSFGPVSCACYACAPIAPATRIYHGIDSPPYTGESLPSPAEIRRKPSFTRAYVHHLLHTHEMSAHSLLVLHNLAVLNDFFAGIRTIVHDRPAEWGQHVRRFMSTYDENSDVFDEARMMWKDVDLARGKGRLAREKEKQEKATLGTNVKI